MNDITVLIPSSPIFDHPETKYIEETISSVRHHLPGCEIIITFDGVRTEQKKFTDQYNDYKNQMLWKCLHEYKNVLPLVFDKFLHQSGMLRHALTEVRTPLLMYVEHDTPLVVEKGIDWDTIREMIYSGEANVIRLHHEDQVPEEHKPLMLGRKGQFMRTAQWSQRPHLSSTIYYQELMTHFTRTSRTMIEDLYHGVVQNDYYDHGRLGWNKHRVWIYYPPKGIKRSYHLDTRKDEPKYKMRFS